MCTKLIIGTCIPKMAERFAKENIVMKKLKVPNGENKVVFVLENVLTKKVQSLYSIFTVVINLNIFKYPSHKFVYIMYNQIFFFSGM